MRGVRRQPKYFLQMKTVFISYETISELESLYLSHEVLKGYQQNNETDDVSEGIFAIYEKILAIATADPIYGIIVSELGDIFEDYIHHVSTNTPEIIRLLKKHIKD